MKLKTEGSMQQAASDSTAPKFAIFVVLGHKGSLALQSSKEWKDVMVVFTPSRCLILLI
jgi:hypothetical protein